MSTVNTPVAISGNPETDSFWVEAHAADAGKLQVDVMISKDPARWPNIKKIGTANPNEVIARIAMTAEMMLEDAFKKPVSQVSNDNYFVWHVDVDPKGQSAEQIVAQGMTVMKAAIEQAHKVFDAITDPKAPIFRVSGPMPTQYTVGAPAPYTEMVQAQPKNVSKKAGPGLG